MAVEKNYWERLMVESIEIRNTSNTANLKPDPDISKIWSAILNTVAEPMYKPNYESESTTGK